MENKDAIEEKELSLYLTQIGFLTEELERYQLRSKELKTEISDIKDEYRAAEEDNKDIHEYLVHRSAKLNKRVKELTEQLEKEQAETENLKAQTLLRRRENQELERRRDELKALTTAQTSKIEEQKQELEQLNELLLQKESDAQIQLANLNAQHQKAILNLKKEEEDVIKRKREELTRCMELKVSAVVQEERAQHKEAIRKAKSLQKEVTSLKVENAKKQFKLDELCSKVDDLRSRCHKVNQDILSLTEEKEKLTKRCQRQKTKHEERVREAEASTQKQTSTSADCHSKLIAKSQLEAQLQRERSTRIQLEGDIKKAVSLLTTIVSDPKNPKKAQLMLKLQKVLESPEPVETGSTEQVSIGPEPQTSSAEAGAETEHFEKDPLFLLAQIRTGDLGLVPRPTWNVGTPHTRTHDHRGSLLPVQEPLWRKALVKYLKKEKL